jgi:hypothetical protein
MVLELKENKGKTKWKLKIPGTPALESTPINFHYNWPLKFKKCKVIKSCKLQT